MPRPSMSRRLVLSGLALVPATLFGSGGARTAAAAGSGRVLKRLQKWECTNDQCEPYVYDPAKGDLNLVDLANPIPPGVAFEDLPDDWRCPICNDPKKDFIPTGDWVEVWI